MYPISYSFFDRDEYYLKRVLKKRFYRSVVGYICIIVDRYLHEGTRDKKSLSRILHEEHVKNVTLPVGIDKKELMVRPDLYKKLIDQKR